MIRNQIEAVVNQLIVTPKFLYGTMAELNLFADNQDWSNGVVMLYTLKPVDNKTTISYAINETFSIYMEFLFLTEFDQYTSQNEIYIDAANNLKNEFLIKLEAYREQPLNPKYFRIKLHEHAKTLPVYNKLDVNSTGISLSLTLETMSNTGYDPLSRPPGYYPPVQQIGFPYTFPFILS